MSAEDVGGVKAPTIRRSIHANDYDNRSEFDPQRAFQHLEKRYFEPGDLGFPVWRVMGGIVGMCICNDRRELCRNLGDDV